VSNLKWYKGNLHTHSHGFKESPHSASNALKWYADHGYDFLCMTEHDHLVDYDFDRLLLIPGQEVGKAMKSQKGTVHINGFGITRTVEFVDAWDVLPTIQANVNAVIEAGGLASINHPNDRYSFDHREILQTPGARFVEIYNGGGTSKNNDGGPGRMSCEEIWDGVLSGGMVIWGIATDDAHTYDEDLPTRAYPGRGWVHLRAEELTVPAILAALNAGEFYASTGVTLSSLDWSQASISLEVSPVEGVTYTTTFSGRNGAVLATSDGARAAYAIKGNEGYVRATVRSSTGKKAWTQPVFLK